jgi:hypothetical protein
VEATIAGTDQVDAAILRARYVVGCDGMHSKVREQAGFTFRGGTYEQTFVLADVRMKSNLSSAEVTLFFSPQGLVVCTIQQLHDARGPARGRVEELIWSSRFRVHHRLVRETMRGRFGSESRMPGHEIRKVFDLAGGSTSAHRFIRGYTIENDVYRQLGANPWFSRRLVTSLIGGAPNIREYSRLNCDALS